MPGGMSNKLITIARAAQAKFSISLEPDSKTYSLTIIDTALVNSSDETYTVTRIGDENVQGFHCIHSKMVSSLNSRFLKSTTAFDVWTSKDVPGYALIEKVTTTQNVQPTMLKALEKAGCGGFFVKMASAGKDYSMSMTLIKTEKKTFPASLFVIPAGYAKSNQNMIYHMVPQAKK
jgi:Domain of unknown function (DUF4412)